jgi:hypothetical protein
MLSGMCDKALKVWDWELIMARNMLFIECLQIQENTNDSFNQIAQQLVYCYRRITNTELAYRISKISPDDLRRVCV